MSIESTSILAEITVSGGELDFSAQVDCSPGTVVVEVTAPSTVAGIRYTYAGGELHTSCGELDSVAGLDRLPQSGAPAILCEALSRLSDAAYDTTEGGADLYRLHLSAGDVVITASDGTISSITADYSPYVITFTQPDTA